MRKVNDTKSRIVSAAWKLFYEQGYDNTTVDDIIEEAHVSKGSFYHYFVSKDSLPASLGYLFDEKYAELNETMDPEMNPIEKLIYMNHELFLMIENTVSVDLLSRLFSSQLVSNTERSLLDTNRTYYKILRQVTIEAQQKGLFRSEFTTNDITHAYAMFERGLMYDWCLSNGNYSLPQYSSQMLPKFLNNFC
ncbi:MAG: TetR/AcrR family transcriptional regulator [Clostridia bacterium]|nr:TetR/AcrR family transcriptional regulator [Clostridia bacterium]